MAIESEIFGDKVVEQIAQEGFSDFNLLNVTANSMLYLAIKSGKRFLIKTTKDNSERQNSILHREYELSIGCDHPHLVHIYTIERFPFGIGLVMEYIDGRTLDEYLAENPSAKERNRIFTELLSAVGYLHKRGVIHNDIKPENVLITRADNSLKLIDFGLSDSDAEYAMRNLGCTPHYASPELKSRSGDVDARSDIYSIGLLMQEIFGHSRIATRCINSDPAKRYTNINALQRAWNNRHRPRYIVLSVLLLSMLLLSIFFGARAQIESYTIEQKQEQMIAQMERDITAICNAAKDSIEHCQYIEFASMHLSIMEESCRQYLNNLTTAINNPEIEVAVAQRYTVIFDKFWRETIKKIEPIPSFYLVTPESHWSYYDSLIDNNLPYRPYSEE